MCLHRHCRWAHRDSLDSVGGRSSLHAFQAPWILLAADKMYLKAIKRELRGGLFGAAWASDDDQFHRHFCPEEEAGQKPGSFRAVRSS